MHAPSDVRRSDARSLADRLAETLARVTSAGELIPEIDGLRFIAIAGVICFHMMSVYLPVSGRSGVVYMPEEWMAAASQSWIIPLAYCGRFGVELFFVISGFILALPFARRAFAGRAAPELRPYYLRRVTRIEPPYVLAMLLSFVLMAHRTGDAAGLVPHLVASLLYSHGITYGEGSVINGVAWSLEVEIQFYLLVPLLVRVFAIQRTTVRRGIMIVAIVAFALLSQWYVDSESFPRLRQTLVNYLHFFLAGFLFADWYLTDKPRNAVRSAAWDVVTVASALTILAILTRYTAGEFLLPFVVLALYAGCFLGRASNALVTYRWTVIIGGMCYTLYLYHPAIITILAKRTIAASSVGRPLVPDFLLQCLLILPVLLAVCSLLFVFVEKPFMRWGQSYRR